MKKVKFFMSLFKERDWLEEMATKGWLLKDMTLGTIYHFEQIEPAEKVYESDEFYDDAELRRESGEVQKTFNL